MSPSVFQPSTHQWYKSQDTALSGLKENSIFLQTFSEKNLSTELMSYVTTMFNPSVAVKLQRSKKDYNFQILDKKLDLTLARLNTNLPDLLQTMSIKYRFDHKIRKSHFQLS